MPGNGQPSETYVKGIMKLSHFFNGEGIELVHMPGATTDGDSVVHFRGSDVISTGDILDMASFPRIDRARGGSIQGGDMLAALNKLIEMSEAEFRSEGGTLLIPGHGRICDLADLAYLSRHGDHHSRPRPMADEKGYVTCADQSRETYGRLGRALRPKLRLDPGHVCGGHLPGPRRREEIMILANLATRATLLLALASSLAMAQGRGGPPPTGKSLAPWDITGYWVSEIVDEWRFRVSPIKGDILYMPINAEARRIANAWDPAKDEAEGNQCKAYGAVGLMQRPGRLHITWADDNAIRVEADAGTQIRTWRFGPATEQPGAPSLQGYSTANWEGPGFGGGRGRGGAAAPPKAGTLKIVTTNLLPGYLRKNGVPYSGKAVYTEYINRVDGRLDGQQGEMYFALTAMVDDPTYLTGPFLRTYQFKRLPDANGWDPTPCWTK